MAGYVYLIGTTTFGWYKIGKSKIPEIRIKDLGILLPFKIEIFGIWSADNHTLLEKTLHEIYAPHRINGEWFEFTVSGAKCLFNSLPEEARIYPTNNNSLLDKFSNIAQDIKTTPMSKKPQRVLGLRIEKLRGDFTPEEREAKRQAGIEKCRLRKEKREANKQLQEVLTVLP